MHGVRDRGSLSGGESLSLPSRSDVDHADWPRLQRMCAELGLNPKGRSAVVRMRVLDHLRRRSHPEVWRAEPAHLAPLLIRLGFPEAATRLWESTIRLDAPAPWIGLGASRLAEGEPGEALKAFDRAAQMGDAAPHLHRAEALAATGDFGAAARACEAYLSARPGDLRGLVLRSSFLARGGFVDEAIAAIRDAFESHPYAIDLWRGLGSILLRAGRVAEAAEAFREATRMDPTDVEAWVNRGAALLVQGKTRDAIGALREALEIDGTTAVALNDLGVAYLKAGQTKSALVNLERAAKHLEVPRILLNVARVRESTRGKAEAIKAYDHVLEVRPRDSEALAARRRLAPRKVRSRGPRKVPRPTRSSQRNRASRSKGGTARPPASRSRAVRRRRSQKKARRPRSRGRRGRGP